MRKLGIGVLGVGEMGKRHAENLRRLVPEARLVAVADAAADRARQVATELEIDHSYGSLEAMLESMAGVHDEVRDALTYYTRPITGAYYFIPAIEALRPFIARVEET